MINPVDQNYTNFDFKTTKQLKVTVSTLNSENEPIGGVYMQIYTQNPLTTEGLLKDDSNNFLAYKGISSKTGLLNFEIAPETFVDSLSVLVSHIGLPSLKQVKIDADQITITVGGSSSQKTSSSNTNAKSASAAALPDPVKMSGSIYLVHGITKENLITY